MNNNDEYNVRYPVSALEKYMNFSVHFFCLYKFDCAIFWELGNNDLWDCNSPLTSVRSSYNRLCCLQSALTGVISVTPLFNPVFQPQLICQLFLKFYNLRVPILWGEASLPPTNNINKFDSFIRFWDLFKSPFLHTVLPINLWWWIPARVPYSLVMVPYHNMC